ncbi:methylated-DNA--[protein]-cysteine S-methyltransferase [Leucobacter luti]|uniref:methylated-DNA--[protein]-cysteine S-methyltransferase n=1 Tax=Leucobacter luti TaxID=340320 RepID=A0A4Q7TZV8_9MICO|nr:methylated-DNA--[protein]-cysteine S-methyltransferase [Leucobacter luti]MBL3699166.1 methylated-DNA--[protein]-cysteine S-methyltransferase [Leucobacter luti]RZT66664.1 methylated-DNA-[protein]-cysteine S-methyltransferase [Leucobacter luti]
MTHSRSGAPLAHAVVDIVGHPFHAIWTPEDGAVRAAGFATAADPGAERLIERFAQSDPGLAARGLAPAPAEGGAVVDALRAYAEGDTSAIDVIPVAQRETPFRGEVWRALRGVRAGEAVTYTELAGRAGRPSAVRAAASGCANNLVALIVPCHRIVRTDGGLGGYLFGVEVKERLLYHEGALR